MAFGEQLQLLRRRSGLTQEQFAEELRVSRQAVSKWESGPFPGKFLPPSR
ncbi:MAG: helix-turn-helix transcriptional regulator [Firmicutes bacterium]|nr:helix-turn-helix transcriptional regulator [Bacillota bacterium]